MFERIVSWSAITYGGSVWFYSGDMLKIKDDLVGLQYNKIKLNIFHQINRCKANNFCFCSKTLLENL